jgi:hypothetical protein
MASLSDVSPTSSPPDSHACNSISPSPSRAWHTFKPREGVPHPLCFSKGAFFALEFLCRPPSPYVSNARGTPLSPERGCRTLCDFQRVRSSLLNFRPVLRIHTYQTCSPALIKTPTAPWPVPRMFHQLPRHRIRMHVIQFLFHLAATIHVEIIEPSLPKSHWPILLPRKWKLELRCQFSSFSLPHRSRYSLLQNLHSLRWCHLHRFADQQMHVLRHQHIPHQRELPPRPHFLQDFHEHRLSANTIQQRPSLIATKGDEVQLLPAIVAL